MYDSLCKYRLENDNSNVILVLDCKTCKNESKRINNESCLARIIRTMEIEYNINSIIMKNYSLTQFTGKSVSTLKRIVEMRLNVRTFKERKVKVRTCERGRGGESKRENLQCENCALYPRNLFGSLEDVIYVNFRRLVPKLLEINKDINEYLNSLHRTGFSTKKSDIDIFKTCGICIKETYKDLTFIFLNYKDLTEDVIHNEFSMVMGQ